MNKQELEVIAEDVFKRYPTINKVFVTDDGQAFFQEMDATNHATQNRAGKELKIEVFDRPDDQEPQIKNSKTLIAEINAAATIEEVEAIVEAEQAGEGRKTVIEAGQKRIEKLKAVEE